MESCRGPQVPDGAPPGSPPGSPPRPLWPGASKLFGQRFTPKGSFDTGYLASDAITALMEVKAVMVGPAGPLSPASHPWVLVSITGAVQNVLDVTDPAVQLLLGTSTSELTGAWAFSPAGLPPTQVLGEAAFACGRIHAIKYHSAKNTGFGTCLAVFPTHLNPVTETLTVVDPSGILVDRLP